MEPRERYLALVEPYLRSVTAVHPDHFLKEFSRVPEAPRHLLAGLLCDAEVCNGGFHQFFTNSTGVLGPEAATAFAAIGMARLADVVRRAMTFFGEDYPRDWAARKTALATYEAHRPDDPDPFRALDDEFYILRDQESGGWDVAADAYAESHGG
jgi:Domain of unknown function (DUF4375)